MNDTQPRERRRMNVMHVAAILAVAIVVGFVLGGVPLKDSAENVESRALRAVALGMAKPLAAVSEGLLLETARRSVIAAFRGGGETDGSQDVASEQTGPTVPTTLAGSSTTGGASTSLPASASTSTTARPAVPPDKVYSKARPLRILAAGDSLMIQVGHGIARLAGQLPIAVTQMPKVSSGLTRTDFYNWPVELKKAVAAHRPDVTVLMYGDNDKQNVYIGNRLLEKFTPDWWVMYRERVQAIIAIPEAAHGKVIWVGMPIMRGGNYSATARAFNDVYSKECKERGIPFVDSYRLFSDKQGGYAPYLPNADGKMILMRGSDGIHLTEAGGDLVAAQVRRILESMYDFE